MLKDIPTLEKFIRQLQHVPYLASKNLYRVMQHFLEMDEEQAKHFSQSLTDLKERVHRCDVCFTWKEKSQECVFCSSAKRNHRTICVVEKWQDLYAIERTSGFTGVYHVLGGVICPLDGIGPEQLTIEALANRAKKESCTEVILALGQTPEGEATSSFIAQA
jgi:recombination protein RecR